MLVVRHRNRLQLGTEGGELDDRSLPLRPPPAEQRDEADHRGDHDAGKEPAADTYSGLRLGPLGDGLDGRRLRGRRGRGRYCLSESQNREQKSPEREEGRKAANVQLDLPTAS